MWQRRNGSCPGLPNTDAHSLSQLLNTERLDKDTATKPEDGRHLHTKLLEFERIKSRHKRKPISCWSLNGETLTDSGSSNSSSSSCLLS